MDQADTYKYKKETWMTKRENRGSPPDNSNAGVKWWIPQHRNGNNMETMPLLHNTNNNIRGRQKPGPQPKKNWTTH